MADVFLIPLHKSCSTITDFPAFPCYFSREQIAAVDGLQEEIDYLFYRINCEFIDQNPYYASIAFAYDLNIVCVLSRNFDIQKIQRVKNADLFKEYAGIGFKAFIDRRRIDEVKRIMIQRDISVSQLATICGYNNVRAFNKRFKELEKINPSQFRKYIAQKHRKIDEII